MTRKIKDPVSCITHMFGAVLSVPIMVVLIVQAAFNATPWHIVSFAIFGAALFLLYSASTVYHMLNISEKVNKLLRKIDHMMIFVLIAGTYTPVCLIPMRGPWGITILCLIWGIAIGGIVLKALWINAPRALTSSIYVGMGWLVVVAFVPLIKSMPLIGVLLLIGGGLMYTAGALIYALKWPPFKNKWFGFHEVFHVFVLAGSAFHIILMFIVIMPIH